VYERKETDGWDEEKKDSSRPKPSRSTPAPRNIREPPARPKKTPPEPLPQVDLEAVKNMDKDVQLMMEKLKKIQVILRVNLI
jgi:protein-serine/threonine kinase